MKGKQIKCTKIKYRHIHIHRFYINIQYINILYIIYMLLYVDIHVYAYTYILCKSLTCIFT